MSALFGAKNFGFISKFMVCLHQQGGERRVEPLRTFFRQGRGSMFRDFMQTAP